MNENEIGRPILPVKNTSRVTVWRGRVFMAPLGYVTMGPNKFGEMIATNGLDIRVMTEVGTVLDED
jgi:hypothetical protein